MQFAVNYSRAAEELWRAGAIRVDRFKCPAWQDLVTTVQQTHPVYVHFPLLVGAGIGDAIDAEANAPADWNKIETLLAQTDTPFVNLHLAPTTKNYPGVPSQSADLAHAEMIVENLLRDVRAVTRRFGADRVIVENIAPDGGETMLPALIPHNIARIINETGCGFLLDLAHARLAAKHLGVDEREYARALPVEKLREVHITGVQPLAGRFVELLHRAKVEYNFFESMIGREMDHLPMTEPDWVFAEWALAQTCGEQSRTIHAGAWREPWIVSFEYGGVSGAWEAITERAALEKDVSRLGEMVSRQCVEQRSSNG
jgi:uncharacterized protein (UPF0276 family)